jgi:hypothetical protein
LFRLTAHGKVTEDWGFTYEQDTLHEFSSM